MQYICHCSARSSILSSSPLLTQHWKHVNVKCCVCRNGESASSVHPGVSPFRVHEMMCSCGSVAVPACVTFLLPVFTFRDHGEVRRRSSPGPGLCHAQSLCWEHPKFTTRRWSCEQVGELQLNISVAQYYASCQIAEVIFECSCINFWKVISWTFFNFVRPPYHLQCTFFFFFFFFLLHFLDAV